MESYALLIAATLNAGTVLAIASLGLLINEKAGIVNLGAEGMMLCAAIAGFAAVVGTGSDTLGFVAGMGAGALMAAVFGVLVIWLNTNQYATGLALSLFGAGFSAFAGIAYVQEKMPERPQFHRHQHRDAEDERTTEGTRDSGDEGLVGPIHAASIAPDRPSAQSPTLTEANPTGFTKQVEIPTRLIARGSGEIAPPP